MISRAGSDFDIILITGEYYDDHPLSPAGVIARVLDARGFDVGIIDKPQTRADLTALGAPKLCFGVTSGSVDSMVHNYTPLKRSRADDRYSTVTALPDRAVIFYCNRLREYFKNCTIVLGGIESSLRRFAHYDYWDNDVRRSILLDSRADILVYGNGEKQIMEIAERLRADRDLRAVPGTCILSKDLDKGFELLPSFEAVNSDKRAFCRMQQMFSNNTDLAQEYTHNYVLQYKYPKYTTADLDWIYDLPYSRKLHRRSLLKMGRFSVVIHRGCIGRCNFCSLALHEGDRIISRSQQSILDEIARLTKHPEFKGYIDDLVGPSSNMYCMDCANASCNNDCLSCRNLDRSHERLIELLRKARRIDGVKRIFIRSGIRYDLACWSEEYIRELSEHHISGYLKIAPEHFAADVLKLMNKDNSRFDEFLALFSAVNRDTKQELRYYFMIGHPGDDLANVRFLKKRIRELKLKNIEQFQLFTPTPMTNATCMYWTGLNPLDCKNVKVIHDYRGKKQLKREMLALQDRYKTGRRAGTEGPDCDICG